MNTLATRKQSEAIRGQMQSIRCGLPYAMDDARDELKQLTDWKYYVRKLPLATVTCAAAAGYMAVPRVRSSHAASQNGSSSRRAAQSVDTVPEKSFAAGVAGSLVSQRLWRWAC